MNLVSGSRFFRNALLYLFLTFLLLSCASNPASTEQQTKALLWKISAGQLQDSYLFGTMHSDDPRVLALSTDVEHAFHQSPQFALEVKLDKASTRAILTQMYYRDGQRLNAVVGEALFQKSLTALVKRGIPEKAVVLMKPWAVFMILNMPKNESGEFMDAILYQKALEEHKQITGLETLQEQVNVFDKMKLSTQVALLRSTLDTEDDINQMLEETTEVYLSKDLNKILALNDKYMKLLDPKVRKILTTRLLLNRNEIMVKRLIPVLKKGRTFIAIGALHLPGEKGVINLLRRRGYTVSPVQ